MQDVVDIAIGWAEVAVAYFTVLGVPPAVTVASPFLLPLALALGSRRILVILAVAAISAHAAAVSLGWFGSGATPTWIGITYVGALVLAIVISADSLLVSWTRRTALHRLREAEPELRFVKASLERERLWRRAGGHALDPYLDAEVVSLAERVLEKRDLLVAEGNKTGTTKTGAAPSAGSPLAVSSDPN